MESTEYCTTILLPKPSQNLPYDLLFESGIPYCRFLWIFSKGKPFLMDVGKNVEDDPTDDITWAFPVVSCSGFMVVTPSFMLLSLTFSNQRISIMRSFINCTLLQL
jgi:hypothetical protein